MQKKWTGVKDFKAKTVMHRDESFITYPRGSSGSACNGDSGGPFVCNIGGVWKQFGIAGQELIIKNSVYTRSARKVISF